MFVSSSTDSTFPTVTPKTAQLLVQSSDTYGFTRRRAPLDNLDALLRLLRLPFELSRRGLTILDRLSFRVSPTSDASSSVQRSQLLRNSEISSTSVEFDAEVAMAHTLSIDVHRPNRSLLRVIQL